eukprot:TRINITY_DN2775_c0_g1_i2.p1 TRINITY_DN2775_c0_g1~~TRINITY_DN2775_c0_g1_i2.p1  ORF type:complete len:300 (-),score=56.92 TRINITY_DN2775_c0_g1_i2:257-1156(-)
MCSMNWLFILMLPCLRNTSCIARIVFAILLLRLCISRFIAHACALCVALYALHYLLCTNMMAPDMLAAFDKRRINLVVALRQRLRPFIKGNVAGFKKVAKAEAEKLRHESYGAEILRHVGYIYKSEAKKHLGGFKGWWAGVQANVSGKMEDLNILMIEAMMHEQIERMATLTPEERMEAEEEFVQQQLIAMWLRARYEMTIVVRHVCKEILRDEKLTKELRTRYAVGLRMLGEIWRSVEVPEYDLGDIPEEMGGGRGESAGNGRTFYENKVAKEASGFGDGAIVQYTEHASFRTAYAGK